MNRTTVRTGIIKAKGLYDPVDHIEKQVGIIASRNVPGEAQVSAYEDAGFF
jgi:hypothetical protein